MDPLGATLALGIKHFQDLEKACHSLRFETKYLHVLGILTKIYKIVMVTLY